MQKNILVADDDMDVVTFVSTVLEKSGYKVIGAKDGEEALNKIRANRPDLIILDILMPKQSGIKLYRELKTDESLKDIPVIILSAISKRTFLRSQEALTEFGGEPVPEPEVYIEKPVEPDDLAKTVSEVLSRKGG
ncbi:MAG: response regulator [Deltaproteobacteria bacterium]|nr:response regulator [Deltaproteobacteria bacterium]